EVHPPARRRRVDRGLDCGGVVGEAIALRTERLYVEDLARDRPPSRTGVTPQRSVVVGDLDNATRVADRGKTRSEVTLQDVQDPRRSWQKGAIGERRVRRDAKALSVSEAAAGAELNREQRVEILDRRLVRVD